MGTRFVIRVEDRNGMGPYNNQNSWLSIMLATKMAMAHNNSTHHPGPFDDRVCDIANSGSKPLYYYLTNDHYFGFSSAEQMVAWFGDFIPELADLGFIARVYEVDDADAIVTTHQCAFVRHAARFVTQYPLRAFAHKTISSNHNH